MAAVSGSMPGSLSLSRLLITSQSRLIERHPVVNVTRQILKAANEASWKPDLPLRVLKKPRDS